MNAIPLSRQGSIKKRNKLREISPDRPQNKSSARNGLPVYSKKEQSIQLPSLSSAHKFSPNSTEKPQTPIKRSMNKLTNKIRLHNLNSNSNQDFNFDDNLDSMSETPISRQEKSFNQGTGFGNLVEKSKNSVTPQPFKSTTRNIQASKSNFHRSYFPRLPSQKSQRFENSLQDFDSLDWTNNEPDNYNPQITSRKSPPRPKENSIDQSRHRTFKRNNNDSFVSDMSSKTVLDKFVVDPSQKENRNIGYSNQPRNSLFENMRGSNNHKGATILEKFGSRKGSSHNIDNTSHRQSDNSYLFDELSKLRRENDNLRVKNAVRVHDRYENPPRGDSDRQAIQDLLSENQKLRSDLQDQKSQNQTTPAKNRVIERLMEENNGLRGELSNNKPSQSRGTFQEPSVYNRGGENQSRQSVRKDIEHFLLGVEVTRLLAIIEDYDHNLQEANNKIERLKTQGLANNYTPRKGGLGSEQDALIDRQKREINRLEDLYHKAMEGLQKEKERGDFYEGKVLSLTGKRPDYMPNYNNSRLRDDLVDRLNEVRSDKKPAKPKSDSNDFDRLLDRKVKEIKNILENQKEGESQSSSNIQNVFSFTPQTEKEKELSEELKRAQERIADIQRNSTKDRAASSEMGNPAGRSHGISENEETRQLKEQLKRTEQRLSQLENLPSSRTVDRSPQPQSYTVYSPYHPSQVSYEGYTQAPSPSGHNNPRLLSTGQVSDVFIDPKPHYEERTEIINGKPTKVRYTVTLHPATPTKNQMGDYRRSNLPLQPDSSPQPSTRGQPPLHSISHTPSPLDPTNRQNLELKKINHFQANELDRQKGLITILENENNSLKHSIATSKLSTPYQEKATPNYLNDVLNDEVKRLRSELESQSHQSRLLKDKLDDQIAINQAQKTRELANLAVHHPVQNANDSTILNQIVLDLRSRINDLENGGLEKDLQISDLKSELSKEKSKNKSFDNSSTLQVADLQRKLDSQREEIKSLKRHLKEKERELDLRTRDHNDQVSRIEERIRELAHHKKDNNVKVIDALESELDHLKKNNREIERVYRDKLAKSQEIDREKDLQASSTIRTLEKKIQSLEDDLLNQRRGPSFEKDRLQQELADKRATISHLRDELADEKDAHRRNLSNIQNSNDPLYSRLKNLEHALQDANTENAKFQVQYDDDIDHLNKGLKEREDIISDQDRQLEELRARVGSAISNHLLQSVQDKLNQANAQNLNLQSANSHLQNNLNLVNADLNNWKNKFEDQAKEIIRLSNALNHQAAINAQLSSQQSQNQQQQQQVNSLAQQLADAKKNNERLQNEVGFLVKDKAHLENRIRILEDAMGAIRKKIQEGLFREEQLRKQLQNLQISNSSEANALTQKLTQQMEDELERKQDLIAKLEDANRELSRANKKLSQEYNALVDQNRKLIQKIEDLKKNGINQDNLQQQLTRTEKELTGVLNDMDQLKKQLSRANDLQNEKDLELTMLKAELSSILDDNGRLRNASIKQSQDQISRMGKDNIELRKAQDDLIEQMVNLRNQVKEKDAKIDLLQDAIQKLRDQSISSKIFQVDSERSGASNRKREAVLKNKLRDLLVEHRLLKTAVSRIAGEVHDFKDGHLSNIVTLRRLFRTEADIIPKGSLQHARRSAYQNNDDINWLKQKINDLQQENLMMKQQELRNEGRYEELETNANMNRDSKSKDARKIQDLNRIIKALQGDLEDLKNRSYRREQKQIPLQDRLAEQKAQLRTKNGEIQRLRELLEKTEGKVKLIAPLKREKNRLLNEIDDLKQELQRRAKSTPVKKKRKNSGGAKAPVESQQYQQTDQIDIFISPKKPTRSHEYSINSQSPSPARKTQSRKMRKRTPEKLHNCSREWCPGNMASTPRNKKGQDTPSGSRSRSRSKSKKKDRDAYCHHHAEQPSQNMRRVEGLEKEFKTLEEKYRSKCEELRDLQDQQRSKLASQTQVQNGGMGVTTSEFDHSLDPGQGEGREPDNLMKVRQHINILLQKISVLTQELETLETEGLQNGELSSLPRYINYKKDYNTLIKEYQKITKKTTDDHIQLCQHSIVVCQDLNDTLKGMRSQRVSLTDRSMNREPYDLDEHSFGKRAPNMGY